MFHRRDFQQLYCTLFGELNPKADQGWKRLESFEFLHGFGFGCRMFFLCSSICSLTPVAQKAFLIIIVE